MINCGSLIGLSFGLKVWFTRLLTKQNAQRFSAKIQVRSRRLV